MNKNAIKKFAIEARKKLIASVSDRAGMLGITAEGCSEPISKGIDFEVYKTVAGTEVTLGRTQCEQRRKLKEQIEARGFEAVVEEVAYTWFNRICAIRFMEVNDYLPTRVRVLSSEKEGKNEPDIVTQAPDVDLDFSDKEHEYILDCKMNNKLDELFKMLFIKQCNKLSEILPELFEATEDYTEMLLNISYTNKDDIIHMLVNQETGIPEADFNMSTMGEDGQPTGQVEIIGWLYQYYNTELKDDTFAQLKKNVKISKERIPAATQLFTPDWIVRYMVENSVGRLWIEHLRAVDPNVNEKETAEKFGWKYYLPEAEQEADVNVKLAEIRTSYKDLKPEDITCIDPCMGSGHILVAMFDVLMDIYKSAGYSERDAAFEIVEHNIHGLDIDKRAYQLAYFAVMMKGRGYNRRFFRGRDNIIPRPQVYAIKESNGISRVHLNYFGVGLSELEKKNALVQITRLIDNFNDAREYGSILKVEKLNWELITRFVNQIEILGQVSFDTIGIEDTQEHLKKIIQIASVMDKQYDITVTNPPYMGGNGMGNKLSQYCKDNYPDSKSDLYSVFIERCKQITKRNAFQAMITQQSWMFLGSFKKLRTIILNDTIVNMAHLGARAFDEISGEVVQTSAFVLRKVELPAYNATYKRVVEPNGEEAKKVAFLAFENTFIMPISNLKKIPESPIAYWLDDKMIYAFEHPKLFDIACTRQGFATGNNDKYLRYWMEVDYSKISKKWFPCNKGGSYRKWFGNNLIVANWENDGSAMKNEKGSVIRNPDYYFREGLTWSSLGNNFGVRYSDDSFLFESKGSMCFVNEDKYLYYVLGLLNSVVAKKFLEVLAPTLDFHEGPVSRIPVIICQEYLDEVTLLVTECIQIAKEDWDSYEISMEFKEHPFMKYKNEVGELSLEQAYELWKNDKEIKRNKMLQNEKRIDDIFKEIYGLNIEDDREDVTLVGVEITKDIKDFISYAIGCVFGRFSTDVKGIVYAGGAWVESNEFSFSADKDNIIPITDEEYFQDDIVGVFLRWLKCVSGEKYYEDNLKFISKHLQVKGNSETEIIRYYFLNGFYLDHCNTYSVSGAGKRPIYWLFESGKENGFKSLIYMHRYNADLIGKIRIDYLHKIQKAIEQAMQSAEYTRDNSISGTEKSYATKRITKYTKQLVEISLYDEAMAHMANQRIELDLDDGVKINYEKFQGIEIAQEGKKALKIDLLAKIK